MIFTLAYLLIGEIASLGVLTSAGAFNRRFGQAVHFNWRDLTWMLLAQMLWPLAVLVLVPMFVFAWRDSVRMETCVCGHRRGLHIFGDPDGCLATMASVKFLLTGEGEESVYCECPTFTAPNVRPRA